MPAIAHCSKALVFALSFAATDCSRRDIKPNDTDRLGIPVPPAAVSAVGAYSRTGRTPGNRELPSVAPVDGGARRPRAIPVNDGGVPL
jgi:hypothetical protein